MNERCRKYRSVRGYTSVGDRIRAKFVKDCSVNPPQLKKVGETDQYSLIQSYKDECDINRLVARYQAGDTSVLQRVQGLFYDATELPTEQTEMMNLAVVAREAWDNLPNDVKSKFNNDKEIFINALFSSPVDGIVSESVPEGEAEKSDEGGKAE